MFRSTNRLNLFVCSAFLLVALALGGLGLARDSDAPVVISASDHGKAFLGVGVEEETEYSEGGARITRVVEDSPAEKAGLEKGDIIVGFDGRTIRGPVALTKSIHSREPGDEVTITIVRDGREQTIDLELVETAAPRVFSLGDTGSAVVAPGVGLLDCEDDDCNFAWSCAGDDCSGFGYDLLRSRRPLLGVQIVQPTEELREHLGSDEDAGVLISKVIAGSPAEEAGLEVGDLIVSVDGETVEDVGDIREALKGKHGETFDVEVIRERRSIQVEVSIPEPEDDVPTGPRAHRSFTDCCPEAAQAWREARRLSRETMQSSRAAIREALREAGVDKRETMVEAREAFREALAASRDARRDARQDLREAIRKSIAVRFSDVI